MGIIAWIVLGAIAGFITNLIMAAGKGSSSPSSWASSVPSWAAGWPAPA